MHVIPIRVDSFVWPPFEVGCGLDEVGPIGEGGASPVAFFGELTEGIEGLCLVKTWSTRFIARLSCADPDHVAPGIVVVICGLRS